MFLAYPPTSEKLEMATAVQVTNFKQMAAMAKAFIDENKKRRMEAGKKDVWMCWVAHRTTGEMRPFNFDPKYVGRLDHAESCFKGPWRLASFEEEAAEYARQAQAKVDDASETLRIHEAMEKARAIGSPAYKAALVTVAEAAKVPSSAALLQAEKDKLAAENEELKRKLAEASKTAPATGAGAEGKKK